MSALIRYLASFRLVRRWLLAGVTAAALLPVATQAHAILLESNPQAGGHESAGFVAVRLRFNSRIDVARSRVTLTRPGQVRSVLPVKPGPTPDVLQADAELGPGTYSLRWQVLAVDGHITRGDVGFTLTPHAGTSVVGTPATSVWAP